MRKKLKKIILIVFLIAVFLETTVMNYGFYYSLFAEKEISWNKAQAYNLIKAKDGFVKGNDNSSSLVIFENIDTKVYSIHIDASFPDSAKGRLFHGKMSNYGGYMQFYNKGGEEAEFLVHLNDENSATGIILKSVKYLSHTKYFSIFPLGDVSELAISWNNPDITINDIILNKIIPINISFLRLFLIFCVLSLIFVLSSKEYKENLKFFLFDFKFDYNSKIQNNIYRIIILFLVLFCLFTSYTAYKFSNSPDQYNYFLPKAFLNGQVSLPIEPSQELLNLENPYDWNARLKANAPYWWDNVFFNGKYYSYYGVVPVLTMFLPYYALSGGQTLPTSFGVFVFAALSCIFMMLLWREIVCKYINNIPFFMFLISGLTFVAVSGTILVSRRPLFYEVAAVSALFFSVLGLFLLLKSIKEKIDTKFLFFACLAFALAVGCRPTAIFCSIFVPVLLWKDFINDKNKIKIITTVLIPYLIIGIPIALYNYARFESFTNFGVFYSLTIMNCITYQDLNFIGKTIRLFQCFWQYIFNPLQYSAQFPFAQLQREAISYNGYIVNFGAYGLINIPIVWYLLNSTKANAALKTKKTIFHKLFITSLIISVVQIAFVSYITGVHNRYSTDFMWLITIPALICACFTYENANKFAKKNTLKLIYIACGISILISVFVSLTGEANHCIAPVYYYIQRAFSIG